MEWWRYISNFFNGYWQQKNCEVKKQILARSFKGEERERTREEESLYDECQNLLEIHGNIKIYKFLYKKREWEREENKQNYSRNNRP